MIVKEYYGNINCKMPKNYFEKWYADVWARRISKPTAEPGVLDMILDEELEQVGATFVNTERGYKLRVFFKNDRDYTMFVLKWS